MSHDIMLNVILMDVIWLNAVLSSLSGFFASKMKGQKYLKLANAVAYFWSKTISPTDILGGVVIGRKQFGRQFFGRFGQLADRASWCQLTDVN